MNLKTLKLALSLALIAVAAPALAQENGGGESVLAQMRREVFAPLGLSEQQKTQLHELHARRAPGEQQARAQLKDAGKALAQALAGSGSTDAELNRLHLTFAKAREAYADYRFAGILEIRKLLTPEQRGKFGELYTAFRMKRLQRAMGGE